eukprot:353368-Chlamydomonas_euryale.AAC.2
MAGWVARWPKRAKRPESQPRVSDYHPETTLHYSLLKDCFETAEPAADLSCHGLRAHQTAVRPRLPGSNSASDRSQAALGAQRVGRLQNACR